jgi:hypothetical protein
VTKTIKIFMQTEFKKPKQQTSTTLAEWSKIPTGRHLAHRQTIVLDIQALDGGPTGQ